MNVLSLFDGMSCGQIALERAGIKYDNYFASEIDKSSIQVTQHNYPNTVQVGDVTLLAAEQLPKIDLLIGGSPCQSISNLGKKDGLEGKSGLFFEYKRLKDETNPDWWLLENVSGNKKAISEISALLGVDPILIDSNNFSAQNRKRLYWTNIPIGTIPKRDILLSDILDDELKPTSVLTEGRLRWLLGPKGQQCVRKGYASIDPEKAGCLTTRGDASWNCTYVTRNNSLTKLSCEEWEKLQTVPVGYTSCAKTSERYRMLGNGWTVDVIAHILNGINNH